MSRKTQSENIFKVLDGAKEDLGQIGYQARVNKQAVICGTIHEHDKLRAAKCNVIPFPELNREDFDSAKHLQGQSIVLTNSVIKEMVSHSLTLEQALKDKTRRMGDAHSAIGRAFDYEPESLTLEVKCELAANRVIELTAQVQGYRKIEDFLQIALKEKENELKALAEKHARIWFVRLGKWLGLL